MTNPRHLWSGDWREESARARQAAEEARARRLAGDQAQAQAQASGTPGTHAADHDGPASDGAAAPTPATGTLRGRPRLTIVAVVLAALVIGAFAIGSVTDGGDAPAPLPAVS